MDESTEKQLRKLQAIVLAQRVTLSAIIPELFRNDNDLGRAVRETVCRGVEAVFERDRLTATGHEFYQSALHEVEQLFAHIPAATKKDPPQAG